MALAAYQRQMDEWDARAKAKRGKPQRLAKGLLRTLLTDEQVTQLAIAHRGVDVIGPETGLLYRLHPTTGITNLMSPSALGAHYEGYFCLHGDDDLPPADISIAHLLWIVNDEMGFLASANVHPSYRTTLGPPEAAMFTCAIPEWVA